MKLSHQNRLSFNFPKIVLQGQKLYSCQSYSDSSANFQCFCVFTQYCRVRKFHTIYFWKEELKRFNLTPILFLAVLMVFLNKSFSISQNIHYEQYTKIFKIFLEPEIGLNELSKTFPQPNHLLSTPPLSVSAVVSTIST